ncbi:hypothetical protein F4810DRAFT_707841 [Camillea tinctor]|nr:hypothetical protein F4810DRAFT_707841 [Camillea tinctor]
MTDNRRSSPGSKDTAQCAPNHDNFMSLLSETRYDILSFKEITDLSQPERLVVAERLEEILVAFLDEIGFQFYSPPRDLELRKDLWAWGHRVFIKACDGEWPQAEHILEGSASIVEHFYPSACQDSRYQLAVVTAVGLHVEFNSKKYPDRLAHFLSDFLLQRNHSEDWYTMYNDVIKDSVEHFGANDPRIGTLGAISLARIIETAPTENSFSKKLPPHLSHIAIGDTMNGCSSNGFAYFFRYFTGMPASYVIGIMKPSRSEEVPYDYWITSVVDLLTFINQGNDLISFPKEVRAGETANYISLQTRARQQAGTPSQFHASGHVQKRRKYPGMLSSLAEPGQDLDTVIYHGIYMNPGTNLTTYGKP